MIIQMHTSKKEKETKKTSCYGIPALAARIHPPPK
jgi:hypothetical protein